MNRLILSLAVLLIVGFSPLAAGAANPLVQMTITKGDGAETAWKGVFELKNDVSPEDLEELGRFVEMIGRLGGPESANKLLFVAYGRITWKRSGKIAEAVAGTGGLIADANGKVSVTGTGVPPLRQIAVSGEPGKFAVELRFDEEMLYASYVANVTGLVMERLSADFDRRSPSFSKKVQMVLDTAKTKGVTMFFKQER